MFSINNLWDSRIKFKLKAAITPMILWAGDSGYDNTAFDMAEGIEPTPACAGEPHADRSILCLGKMWRKTFPA